MATLTQLCMQSKHCGCFLSPSSNPLNELEKITQVVAKKGPTGVLLRLICSKATDCPEQAALDASVLNHQLVPVSVKLTITFWVPDVMVHVIHAVHVFSTFACELKELLHKPCID